MPAAATGAIPSELEYHYGTVVGNFQVSYLVHLIRSIFLCNFYGFECHLCVMTISEIVLCKKIIVWPHFKSLN